MAQTTPTAAPKTASAPAGLQAARSLRLARSRCAQARPDRRQPRPAAVVASRSQDRERAQRRYLSDFRNRHLRPRDQGRHPRIHWAGRAGRAGGAGRAGEREKRAPPPRSAAPSSRRAAVQAGRLGSCRKDVGDAEEDRRAHGHEPAHVGACALRLRGQLLARREDSGSEEGGVRSRRREADLSLVHSQGGRRRDPRRPRRQCVDRRRQHRLSQRREHRRCGRARLGTHRSGHQERGREESPRPEPRGRGSGESRARQAAQAGRSHRRHVYDYEPGRFRRAVRDADHQPAAGGDPRRRR